MYKSNARLKEKKDAAVARSFLEVHCGSVTLWLLIGPRAGLAVTALGWHLAR